MRPKPLPEAVQSGTVRSVDVSGCRSMHTAIAQVQLAAGLPLRSAVEDLYWQEFLSALPTAEGAPTVVPEIKVRRAKAARKRASAPCLPAPRPRWPSTSRLNWRDAGRRVLLVVLDSQGYARLGVGAAGSGAQTGVHRALTDAGFDLAAAVLPTPVENLSVLPADTAFAGASEPPATDRLRRALEGLAFDTIVLDTRPPPDPVLVNAMAAPSHVLMPCTPNHLAAAGVQQLTRLFHPIARRDRPALNLLEMLLVMVDLRLNMHRGVMGRLRQLFADARVLEPVRPDVRVVEAFAHGVPVRLHATLIYGALDHHLLAGDVLARIGA